MKENHESKEISNLLFITSKTNWFYLNVFVTDEPVYTIFSYKTNEMLLNLDPFKTFIDWQ